MGAATALYSATCCAHGKYGNGNTYSLNLSAVIGLSGWLPCSRSVVLIKIVIFPYVFLFYPFFAYMESPTIVPFLRFRSLKNKIEGSQEAARRAATLPLLLCHGRGICCCKIHICYILFKLYKVIACLRFLILEYFAISTF